MAEASDLVQGFMELFAGRTDAVGGNEGLAIRLLRDDGSGWSEQKIQAHLDGTGDPIGIYPLRQWDRRTMDPTEDRRNLTAAEMAGQPEWVVHWGCIDWDQGYEQSWPDALNTHNALKAFGITSWIERSRSKGWHLWVFADAWVPAELMRNALIGACQIVDAPIKEVNPKQTELAEGGLGNYVRLPYPHHESNWDERRGAEGRQTVLWDPNAPRDGTMHITDFVVQALAHRCTAADLQPLAERAQVKQHTTGADMLDISESELDPNIMRKLDGLAFTILRDGPDAGTAGDRSGTLYKLVAQMWDTGRVTQAEAWDVLVDADRRWGKYQERDDLDALWATFEKAWGNT